MQLLMFIVMMSLLINGRGEVLDRNSFVKFFLESVK